MRLNDARWWVLYRTTHAKNRKLFIDSLKPGYHDKSDLMLHANFKLLTDFVEIDKGYKHIWSYDKDGQKAFKKKYGYLNKKDLLTVVGLLYVSWESKLGANGGYNQAFTGKEVMELYLWWKFIRPNRIERWSDDDYIWRKWRAIEKSTEERDGKKATRKLSGIFTSDRHPVYDKAMSESSALDAIYEAEDQYMLKRLINIRDNMWT